MRGEAGCHSCEFRAVEDYTCVCGLHVMEYVEGLEERIEDLQIQLAEAKGETK